MEIEVVQNIESVLPKYKVKNSDLILIPNTEVKITYKIQSDYTIEVDEQKEKIGGGFGNPETNRQVEQAAILYVTNNYQKSGWLVESVESEKRGFDLLCTKNKVQENVEVKGTQGDLISFTITAGEVRQSQIDESFILSVVTSALSNPKLHRFTPKEFNAKFALETISYRASLRQS